MPALSSITTAAGDFAVSPRLSSDASIFGDTNDTEANAILENSTLKYCVKMLIFFLS